MGAFLVQLPSLSPTMEKGNIIEWRVKEGEFIEEGRVIAAIGTDKSTIDYESLDEGYLKKIIVSSGDAVVGQIIAVMIEEEGDAWENFLKEALAQESAKNEVETIVEDIEQQQSSPVVNKSSVSTLPIGIIATVAPPKEVAQPKGAFDANKTVKASPVAKKVARNRNINLAAVQSKTSDSRIVLEDLEGLPDGYGMSLSERSTGLVGYVNRSKNPFTDIPMTQMRHSITNRMIQATSGVPSFILTVAVVMDKLLDLRKQLNSMAESRISINDFIVKASALALRDYPDVNAAYQDDVIRHFNDCDISIAVSIADGLITPIIRSCDTKGLSSISQEIKELVVKAKNNTLSLEEYQGGSFTISNLGMFGIDSFTAILNPPQSAIMAVGGINEEVKSNNGKFKSVSICKLTLTADHRVIDGALAAEFMNAVKGYLEAPVKLVL